MRPESKKIYQVTCTQQVAVRTGWKAPESWGK